MSAGTLPRREGGLVLPADSDAKRARRRRRTRRQRRAALAVAGVCALVLGEALAHVVAWWPPARLKEAAVGVPRSGEAEARDREPMPLDVPLAVDIPPDTGSPVGNGVVGNGVAGAPPLNRAAGLNRVAEVPVSAMRSPGVAPSGGEASARSGRPGDSGAVAAVSPLPGVPAVSSVKMASSIPRAPAELSGSSGGGSPLAPDPAASADALKRAAADALARERNINKVRNFPSRPASHVGND
jgi:hypothetical protein